MLGAACATSYGETAAPLDASTPEAAAVDASTARADAGVDGAGVDGTTFDGSRDGAVFDAIAITPCEKSTGCVSHCCCPFGAPDAQGICAPSQICAVELGSSCLP
jgi:hypothetical protein